MNTPVTATVWTTRSTTINYATENAVLSLCSMNIAKNHWVTLKCSVAIFHYTQTTQMMPMTHTRQSMIADSLPNELNK